MSSIKDTLRKAMHSLEDFIDDIEDVAEDIGEDAQELVQKTSKQLKNIKDKLQDAEENIEQTADEARLQAHLAAMEAHDSWEYLRESVDDIHQSYIAKTKSALDHAKVQAALAKMETRDFINESSDKIRHEYVESKNELENELLKGATEIHEHFSGFVDGLPR